MTMSVACPAPATAAFVDAAMYVIPLCGSVTNRPCYVKPKMFVPVKQDFNLLVRRKERLNARYPTLLGYAGGVGTDGSAGVSISAGGVGTDGSAGVSISAGGV